MNDKQFVETYCSNCGTQRCEGIGSEWFDGCKYKWNHDSYDAAAEIERLNNKIMDMARVMIGRRQNNMRLWHQFLIPFLDRQRLLGQHRECCALRGKGWGKKHSVVDYIFTHDPEWLVAYHFLVMDEMESRGYHPDPVWRDPCWRGSTIGRDEKFADPDFVDDQYAYAVCKNGIIYPEHDFEYLEECVGLLGEKEAPVDWKGIYRLMDNWVLSDYVE